MENKPNGEDLNPLNPQPDGKKQPTTENLPSRQNKRPNIPTAKLKTARLGLDVANNWDSNFPQLSSNLITASDLRSYSQQLKDLMEETDGVDISRKQNTSDLKTLNKLIDTEIGRLKIHIKSEYIHEAELSPIFKAYGLVADARGTFMLPIDNHSRDLGLQTLINKLQEPNNPLANKAFGLRAWQDIQQKHQQLWDTSRRLATKRSDVLADTKTPYERVQTALKNVKKMIRANFPAEELNGKMRAFGFLRESV